MSRSGVGRLSLSRGTTHYAEAGTLEDEEAGEGDGRDSTESPRDARKLEEAGERKHGAQGESRAPAAKAQRPRGIRSEAFPEEWSMSWPHGVLTP